MTTLETPEARGNVLSRLYHGETNFNIVGRWKLWFAVSGLLIAIGMGALFVNGLNLGIDFTGGTVWEVPAGKADVADVEAAVRDLGYDDVQVQANGYMPTMTAGTARRCSSWPALRSSTRSPSPSSAPPSTASTPSSC